MPVLSPRPQISVGPSRHVYDTAVLGGQLGGALASALLAKRGHRVLWIEHDGLGPGYIHGGYLLPYAPFVSPPPRTFPAVEEAFIELGLAEFIKRAIRPQTLQVVLPRHRLDLPPEDPKRLSELKREFGEQGAVLDTAWRTALGQHAASNNFFRVAEQLPPSGFWERWTVGRRIRSFPALTQPSALKGGSELESLVLGLTRFVCHLAEPGELSRTRPLSQVLHLAGRYQGAREGLRDLLCKRLTDLGGVFLGRDSGAGALVESLTFEGHRVAGLKVHGSDAVYRASSVVIATDAGALRRLIPEKRRQRALTETLDTISAPSFLFAINWVLRAEVLPRGMGELLLVATENPELNPMLVQVMPARSEGGKEEPGLVTVCAGAFVPASARELGETHLQQVAEKLGKELARLMPFAEAGRLSVSAPYLDANGVRGSRLMPHPLYKVEGESFLGLTGLPAQSPVRNLFFASREVLPGLGLEGELLAGIQASRLVQQLLNKKRALPH